MAVKLGPLLAGGRLPDADRRVGLAALLPTSAGVASRREASAIRRERESVDRVLVSAERSALLPRGDVPQTDGVDDLGRLIDVLPLGALAGGPGCQELALRRKRQAVHMTP